MVDHLEEWVDVLSLDRDLKFCNKVGDLVNGQVTALIQIEIIEDLLQESWILSSQLEDARLNLAKQVRDGLLGDLGVLFFRDLPGRFHHSHEVLVGGS